MSALLSPDLQALPGRAADQSGASRDARRIRVVHCIDNLGIGGTELNALRTIERLDRERFDVVVATLTADGPLRERYAAAGIPVHAFPLSTMVGARAVREGVRFARFLRAHGAAVVHSHDIYTNIFATFWARMARVPVVIASRRWWQSLPQTKYRLGNRVAYRLAHRVLANSPAVARSLTDADGVAAARVLTVSNFVDDGAFAAPDAAEREAGRRALGIPDGALAIGIIARLSPVKDHAMLLDAFARVRARRAEAHLVIVGDGECRGALEAQAARLGLAGAVTFAGLRHNEPNLHHLFDVSVLASISEGFPNSVVEAMAAARPVVATAVGGTADAVRHGETGLLVPARDDARMAEALERLLADAPLRARLGAAARARALADFHASSVIRTLEQHYVRLVADGRRRGPTIDTLTQVRIAP